MSEGEALVKPNPGERKEGKRREGQKEEGRVEQRRETIRTVFFGRRETSHLSRELGDLMSVSKTTETGEKDFPGEEDELFEARADREVSLESLTNRARKEDEAHPLRRVSFRMPTLLTILEVPDHLHEVDDERFGSSHCDRERENEDELWLDSSGCTAREDSLSSFARSSSPLETSTTK